MQPLSELLTLVIQEEEKDKEKIGALWNQWGDTEALNQMLQEVYRVQRGLDAPFATVEDVSTNLVRVAMFALYATQLYPAHKEKIVAQQNV